MNNFWIKLPKPFFCLAPMEDVTDTVFRQMLLKTAKPDVFFTEFINVEGMFSDGANIVNQRLKFVKQELPLIAQVWGINPENFYKAAQKIVKLGFSGIDINMGCPQKKVIKKGACAGLINNPKLAKEIIQAVKEGVKSGVCHSGKRTEQIVSASRIDSRQARMTTRIPVSVKTRIGFNKIITEVWIGFLLEQDLNAITVHGRTAKEQSLVPAHWDEIGKAVKLRDQMRVKTLIIGNGDVVDRSDGLNKAKQYGDDGIMIGRGIFHNLWAFSPVSHSEQPLCHSERSEESLANARFSNKLRDPSPAKPVQDDIKSRLNLLQSHLQLFHQTWGTTKSFSLMKKYIKIYISGFPEAATLRQKLMKSKNYQEAIEMVKELSQTVSG